jgi:AAA domain/AAA domain, putative AbiEii toxin, Type IV TA system
MIRVERGPAPAYLGSEDARRVYAEAARHYLLPAPDRDQRRREFTGQHADVTNAIYAAFSRKCAYCESAVDLVNVGLHRPRLNAGGRGGTSPDHYWWLAWEWRNMYLVCTACLRAKGTAFPVDGDRAAPETQYERVLETERPLLLDPCAEDPEGMLLFDESGRVVATGIRAMTTIDLLNLNRASLVQKRRQEAERVRGQLSGIDGLLRAQPGRIRSDFGVTPDDEPGRTLRQLVSTQPPFAALRRQLVRAWWSERGDRVVYDDEFRAFLNLSQPPATRSRLAAARDAYARFLQEREQATLDDEGSDDRLYMKTRFIESIELHNVRTFRDLELRVDAWSAGVAPCLAILGENGTGKTTILQAVALALMGPKARKRMGLRPSAFLRSGTEEGYIRVRLTGSEDAFTVRMRRGDREFRDEGRSGPQVTIMAYGPTRLLPTRGSGKLPSRTCRVDNLFRARTALTAAASWLGELRDDDWFRRAAGDLRTLLPIEEDDHIRRGPPVHVVLAGDRVRFSQLSAGYQSVLALASDVMRFAAHQWGGRSGGELSSTVRGILIVDEIDAHLHPRWKMRVLADLRKLFPEVQFLVTTHDPLVLRSLSRGEAVVLERDGLGDVVPETDLPSPRALRIDQLLTSEFFGLASTRDPDTDRQLREYQRLLAFAATDDEMDRLSKLKVELDSKNLLGSDARERLLLRAADAYLGRRSHLLGTPVGRDDAVEVDRMLEEIWERSSEDQ